MEEINKLRDNIKEKRKGLSLAFREAAAKKLLDNFLKLKDLNNHKNIAVYAAVNGEIDLKYIMDWLWENKKNCYLPILNQDINNKNLNFAEYTPDSILVRNKFNILEPMDNNFIALNKLDLVILPLTAFDSQKHRLGMGQGYYDVTFYDLKKNNPELIYLLGAGYDFQKIDDFVPTETDVVLDGVITEVEIIK